MATKYGHIYTKNNSGSVDKFVPILNSTDIKHGDDDNVGEILDKSAKSVETEIESRTETTTTAINEVIFDDVNSSGAIQVGSNSPNDIYDSYNDDNLTELNTNETFTSSQFQISTTGFNLFLTVYANNSNNYENYIVAPNISDYGITHSPYTADSNNLYAVSVSELPSTGQSKIFYPVLHISNSGFEEYTGTDIKFTITNVDGTNYTLSFIWEKVDTVTVTSKLLKTTVTKNDDTEVEESNEISGLLQNSNITFEQKLISAKIYDINAHIELWDPNGNS